MLNSNKIVQWLVCFSALVITQSSCQSTSSVNAFLKSYPCVAYHDSTIGTVSLQIPGRIQNEYFDTMDVSDEQKKSGIEEGKCYHDSENENNGSGKLNKSGNYLSTFRMWESPDISYTKFNNPDLPVDDTPYNLVKPENNSLYLGWIAPGEWINYTVTVKHSGYYTLSTLYTSKFGGHFSISSNGVDITGPLELVSTFNAQDTIDWRQAHHWNKASRLGKFYLHAGKQVLTLHVLDQPVINFDYMDFEKY